MGEGDDEGASLDLGRLLSAIEDAPPVEAVDVLAAELRRTVGGRHVSLLITNFSGTALLRLSHVTAARHLADGRNERAESLPLPGSVYERSMFTQVVDVVEDGPGSWLVLVPVTERGDAIGLLELSLPVAPAPDTIAFIVSAAHALAYVLIASRRHTDIFEWAQRDVPFTLAAEIQRRLLPPAYTLEGGTFTLAGWLEPASDVGGDTFDYALDREFLYASITDAMGHSVDAALLATLAVGSLRNTRRAIASPGEQADAANQALLESATGDQFVTGQLLRIGLATGIVEFVNAGHPHPYLLRHGRAAELDVSTQPALGITTEPYETQSRTLRPGDRLVLVTDGFLERNAIRLDLSRMLESSAGRHPREVVRELAGQVLEATEGNLLDDATVLCIDWYGSDAMRNATGGAEADRATSE